MGKVQNLNVLLIILNSFTIAEQNGDSQRNTVQLLTGPVVPSFARLCPVFLWSQKQREILLLVILLMFKYEAMSMNDTKSSTNGDRLAQLLVLFLQAAFDVQQVIHFLFELLLGGSQRTELLVLGLQVVLSQVTLLGLLLDLQRQVLHLRE